MTTENATRGKPDTSVFINAGRGLVTENEISRKMFIIKEGKARVYKTYLGQRVTLAILGPGEIFGEMSFVDAEPRSASVEALTDMRVVIIDGEKGSTQLEQLPEWVWTIFRTVFNRFREMDQKLTVLQSIHDFRKKSSPNDSVSSTIYLEMLRFMKTLKLIHSRDVQAQGECNNKQILKELDGLLGNRSLSLKLFWRLLKEHDFIDSQIEESTGKVVLKRGSVEVFLSYLEKEMENERSLILSHSGIAVLRRIVGFTRAEEKVDTKQEAVTTVTFQDLQLDRMPLKDTALEELMRNNIIARNKESLSVRPGEIYRLYTFQSFLKAFDSSSVHAD